MVFNSQNHLEQIIEKPDEHQVAHCMSTQGELRVSMNILVFTVVNSQTLKGLSYSSCS